MIPIKFPHLLSVMQRKGHVIFSNDSKPCNLNIVAIRGLNPIADSYDDLLCVFWKYHGWNVRWFSVTTDPGCYYLQHPMTRRGTAIKAEGQNLGVYKLDLHNGSYEALCQRLGPVWMYRDNDKNCVLATIEETKEYGYAGLNYHARGGFQRRNPTPRSALSEVGRFFGIGKSSAGCCVFQYDQEFLEFRELCRTAARLWGNKFSDTLLHERDFGLSQ